MFTLNLQPDGTAGKDTWISMTAPTSVAGATATTLNIGRNTTFNTTTRGLVEFDLTSIPAGAVIVDAFAGFVASGLSGGPLTLNLYRTLKPWVEAETSWEEYSTGNLWDLAGGDFYAEVGGTIAIAANGAVTSSDLRALAQDAVNLRSGLLSMLIKLPEDATQSVQLGSSDNGTEANRPSLVVRYRRLALGATTIPSIPTIGGHHHFPR
jgi:hypothetical protein